MTEDRPLWGQNGRDQADPGREPLQGRNAASFAGLVARLTANGPHGRRGAPVQLAVGAAKGVARGG